MPLQCIFVFCTILNKLPLFPQNIVNWLTFLIEKLCSLWDKNCSFKRVRKEIRKETIRLVVSVLPPAWSNSAHSLEGFSWNFVGLSSVKFVIRIQVWLKSDKSNM